ncbi:MAG TPA: hypothetical protein VK788_13060 [Terriglobales bacterium]|jgi:dipeptidyl aminopeptidase/acylaminoacyl peptidase|nr:hypothetical protein [Terriglobales bacterium]
MSWQARGLASFFLTNSLIIVALADLQQVSNHASIVSTRKPETHLFGVRDSIEMTRFGRNESEAKFSPDGKYFAVVTSKGILASDEIESTLWIFRSRETKELLRAVASSKQLVPKCLARLAAVPQVQYSDSYQSLITDLRWMPDSKAILFLGQDPRGKRHLHRAEVTSGVDEMLTPQEVDAVQFESVGGHIAYRVARPNETRGPGEVINADAREVTGVPLTWLLFPKMANLFREIDELAVVHPGENRRLIDPDTRDPVRLSSFPPPPAGVLALSPDGQTAVALVPDKVFPILWESYEPNFPYLKLHSNRDENLSDFWPASYAAVDLNSGKTERLVNAPNAWTLGSADTNQVKWSSDTKKLLLTNTYLPLDGVGKSEKLQRLHHCAAAIVELPSKETNCVVFATYDRAKKYLMAASFGESDNEVVLKFWNAPDMTTNERYRWEDGVWRVFDHPTDGRRQALRPFEEADSEGLSIAVRQDLNTPPALWAHDRKAGRSKKIWDPNPELATFNLGEASEFVWTDKTGYQWRGGLVKPPNYVSGRRYPLVIQTHGFQANEFITDGAFTTAFAARPLASAGMMVLQVASRHDRMVTRDEASYQVEGLESAIQHLTDDGLIDPNRVGIIGFSRTCYYVESALSSGPNRFAAATLADGVDESYMQYLLFGVGQSHSESEGIYGTAPFGDGLKRWVESAPGFQLSHVKTPLRIEAITPASLLEEWEIYASLMKQGKAVDLIYFPNGQHILQKPVERLASQQGNVDWFRFWLEGEEDSDPTKANQYALWRRLRTKRLS